MKEEKKFEIHGFKWLGVNGDRNKFMACVACRTTVDANLESSIFLFALLKFFLIIACHIVLKKKHTKLLI